MSDRAWTSLTYLALIGGVLGIVAMIGVPQFDYDSSTKQQIIQFVGTIATSAASYLFGVSRRGEVVTYRNRQQQDNGTA